MQRIPITLKLALTLAVPIVVLAFATTLGVRSASHERDEVRRQTELARAAIGPAGLLTALQEERLWMATDVVGTGGAFNAPVDTYEEAYAHTDAAREALGRQAAEGPDAVADAFSGPLAGLDDLAQLRADVATFNEATHDPDDQAVVIEFAFDAWYRYTDLIDPFFDATTQIVGDIEDGVLREGARLSDNVARGIEAFTQEGQRTVAIAIFTEGGVDTREEIGELSRLKAGLARYARAISSAAPPYDDLPSHPDAQQVIEGVDAQADEAITTGRIAIDQFLAAMDMPKGEGLYALQEDVHDIINARADRLDADAESRQLWLLILAGVGLLFVILLNLLVSLSVTWPLRSLTRQAREVAQRRLPRAVEQMFDVPLGNDALPAPRIEPVVVNSDDQVAEVVGALNTVQTSVVDLAAQQAIYRRNISDLFVSLNGRNQQLLVRQIALIGELDGIVTSPVAKASFTQLDHLATQMRRNTESMLAVAGVDARRVWQAPVEVGEVVGYALGRVVDTRRLVVHDLEPAAVAGASANDIVHLLAELIESALEQSAIDDRPVEVRGGPRPETGGYWLAVIDFGAALTPRELQTANQQMAGDAVPHGPWSSLVPVPSPSSSPNGAQPRAARLAQRAGVAVQVDSSAGWGVTVTIDIPVDRMVRRPDGANDPRRAGPAPASRARPLAGTSLAPLPPSHLSR